MLAIGASSREPHPGPPGHPSRRVPWPAIVSVGTYAVIALAAYWPTWPGDPDRFIACPCGDPSEAAWFLAWTPHALLHGADPFFTTVINHPAGINLAANTGMPLLGLAAAPLTLAFGPVSSLNLLLWLAYPLSASSMLFVLRHWTRWYPAAFVGGLLYGFSPYVIGQGHLHLQLAFVPLPPLIALAVYELVVGRDGRPLRWGAVLGFLLTAQFLISTEVFASTCVVVLIALVVLGASHTRDAVAIVRRTLPAVALAVGITVVCLAYPAWTALFGPQRYSVPAGFLNLVAGRSGPLGIIAPTASERFAPSWLASLADTTPGFGDTVENGAYLGLPLLLLAGYFVVRFWTNRWLRFLAVMVVVTYVLALGPHLDLGSDRTAIALPFTVIERLPAIDLIDPVRLSLFTAMFTSVIVALGLDEYRWRWAHRPRGAPVHGSPTRDGRSPSPLGLTVIVLLAASSALLLVPRWPFATVPTGVPSYFTSTAVDRIRPGSTALVYPYPVPGSSAAMLWQAAAGMRFDLLGSYALHPGSHGYATQFPDTLRPGDVQRFLYREQGTNPLGRQPLPADAHDRVLVADLARFLRGNHVAVVLVARQAPNSAAVTGLVTAALGAAPRRAGQVDAWYGVARLLRTGGG